MLRRTHILLPSLLVTLLVLAGGLALSGCGGDANTTPPSPDDGRTSTSRLSDSQAPPEAGIARQSSDSATSEPNVQHAQAPSGDWSNFRGTPSLSGVAAGTIPDNPELLWTFVAEGAIVSSPVVHDGRVYVGSDDGNVYCLDFSTGEKIWAFPTEFLIEAPPMVHAGRVYVGTHDFFMHALDATTGEEIWKFEAYEKIVGSASIVKAADGQRDLLVFGSHDAFVYALDAATGEPEWKLETNDRVNGTLAVTDDNRIVFGGCDTIVYVVDGATGQVSNSVELGGDCNIPASVVVDGATVYLGHHSKEVLALNIDSGEIGWRYRETRAGFYSPPAVTTDRVLVGGRDNHLHCINRETGERVWAFAARRKIDAAPVVCGDRVVVGSGDGRLYMVSLTDGSQVWSNDLGSPIFSSAAIVDGVIIVGANNGNLYAFGTQPQTDDRDNS